MAHRASIQLPLCIAFAIASLLPGLTYAEASVPSYSPDQQTILDAVVDFDLWRIDPAMGVLIDRAEYIAGHPDANQPGLDNIDYRNLLTDPAHYRGRSISIKIQPIYLRLVAPTESGNLSAEKKLWRLDGFVADAEKPADQPVSIFLIADPSPVLGVSSPAEADKEINCATGRPVTISGLFYKTYSDTSRGDHTQGPAQRDYPVIIGWDLSGDVTGKSISLAPVSKHNWVVLALVISLCAAYVAMRVYTTGRRAKARSSHRQTVTTTDGEIDPDLIRAAKEHRDPKAKR